MKENKRSSITGTTKKPNEKVHKSNFKLQYTKNELENNKHDRPSIRL